MHLPQNVVNNAEEKNKKWFDECLVINKGNLFKLSTFIALFRSSLFHSPFHSNTLFPSLPQSQGVRCVTSVKIPLVPSTVLKTFVYSGTMASSSTRPQSNDWVHYCFKVIIIGDYKVGKTSLLCKYTGHQYRSPSSTISVDFRAKNLERNGKRVKLQIWDIAGQERFRTAVASYYRGAVGVILVYDVTNRESFRNIGYWLVQFLSAISFSFEV